MFTKRIRRHIAYLVLIHFLLHIPGCIQTFSGILQAVLRHILQNKPACIQALPNCIQALSPGSTKLYSGTFSGIYQAVFKHFFWDIRVVFIHFLRHMPVSRYFLRDLAGCIQTLFPECARQFSGTFPGHSRLYSETFSSTYQSVFR